MCYEYKITIYTIVHQLREIANLDEQRKCREMCGAMNAMNMNRPMVAIDQIPWHEMDNGGELEFLVSDLLLCGINCEMLSRLVKRMCRSILKMCLRNNI